MEYMILPLRRYADFRGRSRRKEYWLFGLLVLVVSMMLFVPALERSPGEPLDFEDIGTWVRFAFILAILVPSLALQVRRFHDQDRSGWFVLLGLVPAVGGLIVFAFMCLEGTHGPNRFGDDPIPRLPDA